MAVMHLLAATEVGKFPPVLGMEFRVASLLHFFCQQGRRVVGGRCAI